jgi:hypothetical protein
MLLSRKEIEAIEELKRHKERGTYMGRRRMVSMQSLEDMGLVKRLTRQGMVVGWELTPSGETWREEIPTPPPIALDDEDQNDEVVWLIYYQGQLGREPEIYRGFDAEIKAKARFQKQKTIWNVILFKSVSDV